MADRIEGEEVKEVNDAQVWTSSHRSGRAGGFRTDESFPTVGQGGLVWFPFGAVDPGPFPLLFK